MSKVNSKYSLMKFILTLVLSIAAFSTSVFAQNSNTLKVNGQAFYNDTELKDVIIEIYKDGEKYSESTTSTDGEFEFYLVGEGNYVFKAMREGYFERFVVISTYTGDEKGFKSKKYHFDLSMYKDKNEAVPSEVQEIPMIQYRANKKDFAFVEII